MGSSSKRDEKDRKKHSKEVKDAEQKRDDHTVTVLKVDEAPKKDDDSGKKKKPEPVKEVEESSEDEVSESYDDSNSDSNSSSDSESESESDESSGSEDSSDVSFTTTDVLSNDPLYFVLSKFFMTEDNKNIATILEEINKKLGKV